MKKGKREEDEDEFLRGRKEGADPTRRRSQTRCPTHESLPDQVIFVDAGRREAGADAVTQVRRMCLNL